MTDSVASTNPEYQQMFPNWNLTASLRGGTPAMRAAGKIYLPQEPDEKAKAYENRLSRSVLTNLYKRTVDKLASKPLKKPIIVEEDVPAEIRVLLDDIDQLGTRLDVFALELMIAAMDDGLTHVLVDFPSTASEAGEGEVFLADGTNALSIRQLEDMNARPFARHVRAADLIGWKTEIVGGRKVLSQIRIWEATKEDTENDEFAQDTKQRVRVIERDNWRLFEKQEREGNLGSDESKEAWVLIDQGPNSLGEIPLRTLYTNQTGFMMGEPWLLDVAHMNVAHWQSDSDQRNLLHIARVPILFAVGFGNDDTSYEITIGSNSFVKAPKGSDLKYVEHSGQGIEAGRNDLRDIEERIQLLGMEMLIKRPSGNTTATARTLDQAEADSMLGMVSQELENTLEEVLDLFARWMELGEEGGGSLTVFKDFGLSMADATDVETLLKAKMGGEISQLTFLKEVKRRGLLSDDFDPQTEIDLLDLEGAGSASIEEPDAPLMPGDEPPDPEHPGRNKEGDVTSEEDGHRHVLEANGKTSTEADEDGVSHSHTWDEFAVRTSVEDGHSHVLLTRAAQTKAPPPQIPPPDPEAEGDNVLPFGGGEDE
jgi:hypothetical protein